MKANKYILASLFAAGLMFSSCENALDVEPDSSISVEKAKEMPEMMLNGVYINMLDVAYYGRNYILYGDLGTDNLVERNAAGRFLDHLYMVKNQRTLGSDMGADQQNLYNAMYKLILQTNVVLASEELSDDLKGQALFLRAMFHFDLVSTYGSVPLVTEVLSYDAQPAKASVNAIYTQIEADLAQAATLISNTNKDKATVDAVHALESRVFLFMADEGGFDKPTYYAKAVTAADMVSGSLAADYQSYFQSTDADETIFELVFVDNQSRGSNNLGSMFLPESYGSFMATPSFVNSYAANDTRSDMFRVVQPGEIYVDKFIGQGGVQGLHSPKVLRYAEVLLNKAEALAKSGDEPGAAAIIEQIRTARYTAPTAGDLANGGTIAEVMDERRKELAFEGYRMKDLRRNDMSVTLYKVTDMAAGTQAVQDNDWVGGVVPAADKQFWIPIPNREILANPNLNGNNHGY